MIPRLLEKIVYARLAATPAVALLGPRQVGKTTLALNIAATKNSIYLDLENPVDRAKLQEPLLYFGSILDKLVIIDEIQRFPELFLILRGLIDQRRRVGQIADQYLLLGSASIDLIKQSSESLAGRIAYEELYPLNVLEVNSEQMELLWIRGGFPDSFLSKTDQTSFLWRQNFITTYLERDIPALGPRIPAETLRRFWIMLAHNQAEIINMANIAASLAIDGKTVARYLDLLVDLLLVRRLMPYTSNIGKRVVRSPKIYIRDSGIVHALLYLHNRDALLEHSIAGSSWEGFVVEAILSVVPKLTIPSFYRSSGGAEIDLILELPNGDKWAIEIKFSLTPKLTRGFYVAFADIKPDKAFIVYPGKDRYLLAPEIEVISLREICDLLLNRK